MTKTEFLNQGVDDLRAALLDIFEDENGELSSATKADLQAFAKDNWDEIEPELVEEDPTDSEVPSTVTVLEGEEIPIEDLEVVRTEGEPDPNVPNPRTDLYTGRMRPKQDPTVVLDLGGN